MDTADLTPGTRILYKTLADSPRCWTVLSVWVFADPVHGRVYLLELSHGERRASVTVREGAIFAFCEL